MAIASYQWKSGEWQPATSVPLSDRGFRHGMSAFATVRIHHGKLISLPEHLEKLRVSCAAFGLRQPPEGLGHFVPEVSAGLARIHITAGDGAFLDGLDNGRIFVVVEAGLERPPPVSLAISETPHEAFLPGQKTGNYWPNIAAFRSARNQQADEIVLVNTSGHVISASLANLFAVLDGEVLTPRVASGARAGVMRDWVIARTETIVGDFHPEQLGAAGEIFLASSAYGIAPIATFRGRSLPGHSLGAKLRDEYLEWLEKF